MIVLKNVTLLRGSKPVLKGASATLHPGEKVGLVGRNGAGKSSLFAMLTNRLQPDAGDCDIPAAWLQPGGMAEVAQEMPETDDAATDFVLQGDTRLMHARAMLAEAEAADDGNAMGEAYGLLQDAGDFDSVARAQSLLMGLGFRSQQLMAPVNSFSGGWRMRLQLARALMCPSRLLLLDEPTNHLDLDALVWLEGWLQRYEGTMLVISHDREFLDAITRVTLHLDEAQLTRYTGGYTAFEAMRAERMTQHQAAYGKQQERMAHLQKFIDRFKAKASKAKQAQSRVKALERMEKLAPILTASDFEFEFPTPASLPNPMIVMSDLKCGYALPEGETGEPITIVHDINRSVLPGQRIGILGANGQGKSTLVKTLAHMLPAVGGHVTEGKGLSIGYFAQQELDVLRTDEGPLQHMVRLAKEVGPMAREQELRDFLGRFRFTGDMVMQPVGQFSGGEKARLVLALVVWQRPNLLLLDEPTNHLDLTTREALSIALNEFEGTVMLVSHDRAMLREVCDEFWLVTRGGVSNFDGDLDDYQRWLKEQAKILAQEAAAAQSAAVAPKAAAPQPVAAVAAPASAPAVPVESQVAANPAARKEDRKTLAQARQRRADQAKPLKQALSRAESTMAKAQAEQAELNDKLASGQLSPTEFADVGKRLKALSDQLEATELEWLDLGEQIEALTREDEA
jgi:ATP-binding cassette subfamily F protein 3